MESFFERLVSYVKGLRVPAIDEPRGVIKWLLTTFAIVMIICLLSLDFYTERLSKPKALVKDPKPLKDTSTVITLGAAEEKKHLLTHKKSQSTRRAKQERTPVTKKQKDGTPAKTQKKGVHKKTKQVSTTKAANPSAKSQTRTRNPASMYDPRARNEL
jgi:FtsZ-interacting cell division protein ZipA